MRRTDSSFAVESYLAARARWRGARSGGPTRTGRGVSGSTPFSDGRDPLALGELLADTADEFGWQTEMEQARVIREWPQIIGVTTADHTSLLQIRDGVIVVQCDSTAWTTELRRLRAEILTRILRDYPRAGITDLRFLAPGAPTWQHGPRRVPGRGPRDTYG